MGRGLQVCPRLQAQERKTQQTECLSAPGRLTPTRPNSQAKSRGVLPELSTMHGLDWCCSSISDCGAMEHSQPQGVRRARASRHPAIPEVVLTTS